jgi:hypothetical protein
MVTTPWWREFFEDIFPKPEAYKPKDRTLSQLQHIHNSDTASEAVDDYRAEREEAEASLQQARYEHLEAYTKKLVAEAERRTWEDVKRLIETQKKYRGIISTAGGDFILWIRLVEAIDARLSALQAKTV